MGFTKIKILSYRAPAGSASAGTLLKETQEQLVKLFALTDPGGSLTAEEKQEVKVLSGAQGGWFSVFVLIPFQDAKRLATVLSQVWDPKFLAMKDVDTVVDVQSPTP